MTKEAPTGPRLAAGRRIWITLAAVAGLLSLAPLLRRLQSSPSAQTALSIHPSPQAIAELRFAGPQGADIGLAAFRGRTVLLNIWATWCPPCREEMPTLDRLQARLGGPSFEVVALSIDQGGMAVVQAFFARTGIKHLRLYIDTSGEVMSLLGANGVPLTLLVDSNGREIGRKLGPAAWDDPQVIDLIRSHLPGSARSQAGSG